MAVPSFVLTHDEFRKMCNDYANRIGLGGTHPEHQWLADLPIEEREKLIESWIEGGMRPPIRLVKTAEGHG